MVILLLHFRFRELNILKLLITLFPFGLCAGSMDGLQVACESTELLWKLKFMGIFLEINFQRIPPISIHRLSSLSHPLLVLEFHIPEEELLWKLGGI